MRSLSFALLALVACSSTGGVTDPPTDGGAPDRSVSFKCVGPTPMERAATPVRMDGGDMDASTMSGDAGPIGQASPIWALQDFNPQSCGNKKTYGIESFRGRATLVALLAGWCGFCQNQARMLEKMRLELEKENVPVWIVSINASNAIDNQASLSAQCAFPLFQDKPEHDVWALFDGLKDDFYIYDAKGNLRSFFSTAKGTPSNDLSTSDGYGAVKKALIDASK